MAHTRCDQSGNAIRLLRKFSNALRRAHYFLRQHTLLAHKQFIPAGFRIPAAIESYDAWVAINQPTPRSERDLQERLANCPSPLPSLAVIMPVYNPPLKYLAEAVDSVCAQVIENWELCIADDASSDPVVRGWLGTLAASDNRVKVDFRAVNGHISHATNSAAALAESDYLVFLDQDDLLAKDALAEVALYLAAHPETDLLYTDDDKIDTTGQRYDPQFKPDWSPELLLSYMYFGHLLVVRRSLFRTLGGMRPGFEGAQDYDFALRAAEQASRIGHLPRVLYHWRALPGSTAVSGHTKPDSFEAGRRAVQESLERRNIAGKAIQPEWALRNGLGLYSLEFPDEGPSVAIIIPTRNQPRLLKRCLDSLAKTTYRNHEVLVIDNDSDDSASRAYIDSLPHRVIRIASPSTGFSFSYLNNQAAEQTRAEFLLFLNDDTEILEPRWLSRMVGYARMKGVGAVGARLLYPDGRIQHAGIVHGFYHGLAGPAFKLAGAREGGYLTYLKVARNYSAVTAACLLTPRALFQNMGGFDEADFAVAYNDVDYCYRLVDRGLRCVYCSGAELTHHEGASRRRQDTPSEIAAFRRKYLWRHDPWYSPHLSLDHERFAIKPRRLADTAGHPVRTLMCAFTLNWEGAPYSQFELTVRLKREAVIDPVVYCPSDGPLRQAYERENIPVHVFPHPLRGVYSAPQYREAISGFTEFARGQGIELVYGNTLETFYAIAAARELRLPSVWNVRESEPWQKYFNRFGPHIAPRALECFRYPYRVVFVADATRVRYRQLDSHHNFTTIHNGIDLDQLRSKQGDWARDSARGSLNLTPEDVILLLPGTVCERKGQHDLAHALEGIPSEYWPNLHAFIVGDRPCKYSTQLKKIVAGLPAELRSHVQIVPETADIGRYYLAADIFICTSRVESYPRVILEAMAYGLPIVTTPVFGIREQVMSGINALFYKAGRPSQLASVLTRLLANPRQRANMATQSPVVLSTLNSFDEMARAYGDIFREAALSSPGD